MTMTETLKDIVDDQDNIIGFATKSEVRRGNLLHRGVKVFFITPSGDVIFQRRHQNKDVCPGLLDSTAGGGVDHGESYIDSAIREIKEETGVTISPQNLFRLDKKKIDYFDPLSGINIHCYSEIFGYVYNEPIESLIIEDGAIDGFVSYKIETLWEQPIENFIPFLLDRNFFGSVYDQLHHLIK